MQHSCDAACHNVQRRYVASSCSEEAAAGTTHSAVAECAAPQSACLLCAACTLQRERRHKMPVTDLLTITKTALQRMVATLREPQRVVRR
jgi:hypothetical protein